jgi:mono/diheme cytochrome c family protein
MRGAAVRLSMFGVAAAGLAWTWPWLADRMGGEAATIARGETLYAEHCTACHGAKLEGQPDWQSPLPSGRLPAPPHDASGHTWHHPDGVLFRITREGAAAVVGGGYESDMPGFGGILGDEDIRAILAFIKSTWPERERAYQAEMSRREREKTQ